MARLTWDNVGDRIYELGIDRGVLYLSDGSGVPWNGLTSVDEDNSSESEPVYFDGMKYRDVQSPSDYSATLKAFTYPDEFLEFEGYESAGGLLVGNQRPKNFGLSYRTLIGNDLEGSEYGYKIHVLYNLSASPDTKSYASMSDQDSPSEFSWSVTGVPKFVPGFRPTCHIVFDSTKLDPADLSLVEDILYGTDAVGPRLPNPNEFVNPISFQIINNGDGTWTATGPSGAITEIDSTTYELDGFNIVPIDADSYTISEF